MLNHITIMGRLVADPELRTTPQGVTVATMRLAVDRDFKTALLPLHRCDILGAANPAFGTQFFHKTLHHRLDSACGRVRVNISHFLTLTEALTALRQI